MLFNNIRPETNVKIIVHVELKRFDMQLVIKQNKEKFPFGKEKNLVTHVPQVYFISTQLIILWNKSRCIEIF